MIEDDVEIGANTTVDRPAVGETRIGAGTKIDNLVQIAHGVKVGRNVLLAAQVGIAGSTVLGDDVVMAGQSGATGHVRLGQGVVVGAKSAVTKDIPAGRARHGHSGRRRRRMARTDGVVAPAARIATHRGRPRSASARPSKDASRLHPRSVA